MSHPPSTFRSLSAVFPLPTRPGRPSQRARVHRPPSTRRVGRMSVLAASIAALMSFASVSGAVADSGRVVYQLPVSGRIVDDWRPPENPYGAGNRGIDLLAVPGETVFAAADGTVTFAGQVGGSLFVVMIHADGLRTTIGFVGSVLVRVGAVLPRGAKVAVAKGPIHFGVRKGDTYLDPRTLFTRRVWLVS